jgi:hypothetical protein
VTKHSYQFRHRPRPTRIEWNDSRHLARVPFEFLTGCADPHRMKRERAASMLGAAMPAPRSVCLWCAEPGFELDPEPASTPPCATGGPARERGS